MGAHSLIDWRPWHELLAPSAVDPKTRRERECESGREKKAKVPQSRCSCQWKCYWWHCESRETQKTEVPVTCWRTHAQHSPPPSSCTLNSPWDMYAKISVKICTHYRLSKVILVDWTSRWLTQLPLYTSHLSFSHSTRREQFVSYL